VKFLYLAVVALLGLSLTSMATAGQKLYVLSSEGQDMAVIEVASNRILAHVEVGDRPHGIAAPRSQDILYVSTEHDNGLTVVDPRTDTVVKKYSVFGGRPNEIDITSDGRFIYLPILKDGVYQVFDTVAEKIVAEFPTDGLPHNAVISPDDRFAYLSPMDRGNKPGLVMKVAGYPSSENEKIYVADISSHEVIATIDTGGTPRPIAISPDGRKLYVNRDGLQGFVVLDLERREIAATVEYALTDRQRAIPSRSHGLFAAPNGRDLWVSDVNNGLVFLFDVSQTPPKQIARIDTGASVYWLTGTPDGKRIYTSSPGDDRVTVIDTASRKVTATIELSKGSAPKRMLVLDVPDTDKGDL
jgi:YVTN family beta-propeller protein